MVEIVFQFFGVQGINRHQFFDGINDGHGIGLDLIGEIRAALRILHPCLHWQVSA